MQLIGEYLRDEMTLKRFFKELSGLTSPISSVPGGIFFLFLFIIILAPLSPLPVPLVSFFDFIFFTYSSMHFPSANYAVTDKDIYRWLVHLLIYSDKDPAHKLMNFLLENGVSDNDLEYGMYITSLVFCLLACANSTLTGSVKRLLSMYNNLSEESEKKARDRPRIRKSVSKGLRNPPNKWAKEESQRLIQLVNDYGDKSWKKIAEHVGGGKTGAQCGMQRLFTAHCLCI